jgi:hypothetical protein
MDIEVEVWLLVYKQLGGHMNPLIVNLFYWRYEAFFVVLLTFVVNPREYFVFPLCTELYNNGLVIIFYESMHYVVSDELFICLRLSKNVYYLSG